MAQNQLVQKGFILAFSEIFLKSRGVESIMRKRLLDNLTHLLKKAECEYKIRVLRERIFVESQNAEKVRNLLKGLFGISWFGEAYFFPNGQLSDIQKFIEMHWRKWIKENETFAMRIEKAGGDSESRENIIEYIAPHIKRCVNLDNPDKEIFIEHRNSGWFIYFKKERGAGGLPVSTQGKVLTLMSGGIDSPVAAYMIARRGATNIWLHFHSFPLVSQKSIEKVRELAQEFLRFQPSLKTYFVPFSDIQLKIKLHAEPKYRILLYRRAMMKISERIARKERCEALATGEALGQVGSQTARNLAIIEEITKIPILRPLIGMDKEEIIERAKRIGTYATSIKPQEDCCTLFIPPHPTAKGKISEIKKFERALKLSKLINDAMKRAEVEKIY